MIKRHAVTSTPPIRIWDIDGEMSLLRIERKFSENDALTKKIKKNCLECIKLGGARSWILLHSKVVDERMMNN